MPKKPNPTTVQPFRGLTSLQQAAVALLADGASDEKVAAALGVPLAWVRSLEGNLPIAASVVERQWRKHQAIRLRIRSLVDRALDVVEEELEQRPSPELAVAILRTLRVDPPEAKLRSAEVMLRDECRQRAEIQLQDLEAREGLGFAWRNPGAVDLKAMDLFDQEAPKRLVAVADPVSLMGALIDDNHDYT